MSGSDIFVRMTGISVGKNQLLVCLNFTKDFKNL